MPTLIKSPDTVPIAAAVDVSTPRDTPRALLDHLDELRRRLWVCLAWAAAFSVAGYYATDALIHAMARMAGPLVFLHPTEAFMVKLKLAGAVGLFAAAPVLLYHVWRYIGIALTLDERRVLLGALPLSYLLFAAGVLLSWCVISPAGLRYLTGFASEDLRPAISLEACFNFTFALALGMGILFQLPLVLAALAWWGVIDAAWLSRYRRHAFLIILVVAGIVTPGPDIFSQVALAIPTYGLFELSILFARLCGHPSGMTQKL